MLHFVFYHQSLLRLAALGSWLGLAVVFPQIEGDRALRPLSYVGRACAFFLAALITRFSVLHVESRLQMAAFCILAAGLELVRAFVFGGRSSISAWAVASIGACAGVLLAKRIIEPGAISVGVMRLLGVL